MKTNRRQIVGKVKNQKTVAKVQKAVPKIQQRSKHNQQSANVQNKCRQHKGKQEEAQ